MKKIIVSVLLVLLVGVSTIMGTYAVIINVVSDNGVDKIIDVINIKDLLSDDNVVSYKLRGGNKLSNDYIYDMIVNDINSDDSIYDELKNKVIDKGSIYRDDISNYVYDIDVNLINGS